MGSCPAAVSSLEAVKHVVDGGNRTLPYRGLPVTPSGLGFRVPYGLIVITPSYIIGISRKTVGNPKA